MKKSMFILCGLTCAASLFAQEVKRTSSGATNFIHTQDVTEEVRFYAPDIVRVIKYPSRTLPEKKSYPVVKVPETVNISYSEQDDRLSMKTDYMEVVMDKKSGKISFKDAQGNLLVQEKEFGTNFIPRKDGPHDSYLVSQRFMLQPDETIYGLGQQQTGKLNQRGQELMLRNENTRVCIPYITSEKGYGIYWDNPSPTIFSDTPQETSFNSEAGLMSDYYFMYKDGTQDGVIACIRDLSGQATMFPLWTMGFWQCRERYKSSDELCEVLDKYRELGVPLDGIVQDWQYWGCDSNWNAMKFMNPRYINKMGDPEWMKYLPNGENPNAQYPEPRIKSPKEMVDYVHKNNAHLMISVWASFGPWTEQYKELDAMNALLKFETWPRNAGVHPYDPFNPKARDLYWRYLKNLYDLGIDAWWTDSTEPDRFDMGEKEFSLPTADGTFRSVHNAFPLLSNQGVYEHQRAVSDSKRLFLMTRSTYLGQQRYGSFCWSGDVVSQWNVMRKQIAGGLNYSLCGIPYWNTDIGGFFGWEYGNNWKDVAMQELQVRWMQWGCFMPIMRNHCSSPMESEIYKFGEEGYWAYDVQKKFIELRYRLLPYIYSLCGEATQASGSIMRPFVMDFPRDKKAIRIDNEYMFGRNLLVMPVTDSLYTYYDTKARKGFTSVSDVAKAVKNVKVYLPQGAKWYNFWTNEQHAGGQTVNMPCPIDIMPVYVKAGSILPFGPAVQYATEKKWDNLEIRIYPGADGEFTLYEDEGDNYNYENGAFSQIRFHWNDAARTLTIGERKGDYKGMLKKRNFRILVVNRQSPSGDKEPTQFSRSVRYNGKAQTIKL
ncbi:TIM-barrel domain-containing protein [uncultured Paraprevotella sp.]|uniref:glycoside hydrolase family 31 protein n=1 Tax=Paraprevotella clara TaxID=454154 RepID=UPI00259BB2C7|nr:TIM-barrel domain-containing protein [uncultured Paraprevotella sp.]